MADDDDGFIDFKALQNLLKLPGFEGDVHALIDTFCLEVWRCACNCWFVRLLAISVLRAL